MFLPYLFVGVLKPADAICYLLFIYYQYSFTGSYFIHWVIIAISQYNRYNPIHWVTVTVSVLTLAAGSPFIMDPLPF